MFVIRDRMMLRSAQKATGSIVRYLANSATSTNKASDKNENEKQYTFDLKYAIKQYDPNYEQINPLVTIKHESNTYNRPVIIFPGFEGRITSVEPVIGNLKRTVHCMQYPFEKSKSSISEMTDSVEQVLEANNLLDQDEVNVLGHSFGGVIAVEFIRRLEKKGKRIRLCLTDSSPYAIKIMTIRSFGDVQQGDEFEKKLIFNIANSVDFQHYKMLEDLLKSHVHWQDKIDTLIPLIAKKTNYDIEHLKTIAISLRKVLRAIYYYDESDVSLEAETTLVRSSIKVLPFPEDFKLSKIFKNKVKEFRTDGHHMSMLKFPRTADLINEAFEKKTE